MDTPGWILLIPLLVAIAGLLWWSLRGTGSSDNGMIAVGKSLPAFTCQHEDGTTVSTDTLRGQRVVMLFVRGSWCPFCSEQVQSLTDHYRHISDVGGKLIIITRRPLSTTQRVADQFNVPFEFWLDKNLAAAQQLQLVDEQTIPDRFHDDFGRRTIRPTVLVIDRDGVIRYSHRASKPSDRPDPARFMSVFDGLD
ncbi:MAG: redoxin domain-containing protein [Pseudomonadota bacterium]